MALSAINWLSPPLQEFLDSPSVSSRFYFHKSLISQTRILQDAAAVSVHTDLFWWSPGNVRSQSGLCSLSRAASWTYRTEVFFLCGDEHRKTQTLLVRNVSGGLLKETLWINSTPFQDAHSQFTVCVHVLKRDGMNHLLLMKRRWSMWTLFFLSDSERLKVWRFEGFTERLCFIFVSVSREMSWSVRLFPTPAPVRQPAPGCQELRDRW